MMKKTRGRKSRWTVPLKKKFYEIFNPNIFMIKTHCAQDSWPKGSYEYVEFWGLKKSHGDFFFYCDSAGS